VRDMTTTEARQMINEQGRKNLLVVHFTKKNGEHRRMLCYYRGASSRSASLMTVFDVEKGADRSVNLNTVESIKVMNTRLKDREPVKPKRSFEEMAAL